MEQVENYSEVSVFNNGESKDTLIKVLDTIISLSTENDSNVLLSKLLDAAMNFTNCDAGTIYQLKDNKLHFARMVTKSLGVRKGGYDDPAYLPPVPMDAKYACAKCAIDNKVLNIPNVHASILFDFTGTIEYDKLIGYYTKSTLIVPLAKGENDIVGVLQLINAKDENGELTAFNPEAEIVVKTIASQAAISMANLNNAHQLTRMMDSIVDSLSVAIDSRSFYTTNHTENMVRYAEAFLNWLKNNNSDWVFDDVKRTAFIFSIRLHDVGKIAIPTDLLDKPTRLGSRIEAVLLKLKAKALQTKIDVLEGRVSQEDGQRIGTEIEDAVSVINAANVAETVDDAVLEKLANVKKQGLITEEEFIALSVKNGTLSGDEREIIKSHVSFTKKILKTVDFPQDYSQVPVWAGMHHEYLDGSGYPDGLKADSIPNEARLITIIDIYDALTASDRPYKEKFTSDAAFDVLRNMAKEDKIDSRILEMFIESEAWK